MLVSPHNVRTRILRATPEEMRWARHFLTARVRARGAPREVSLLDRATESFPTGALEPFLVAARANAVSVEVADRRVQPVERNRDADLSWLRPHQRAAIERTYTRERGIWRLPTGAGKGELGPALALTWPVHWLVLVHRRHLMEDLAGRWERRTGQRAGRIGAGVWAPAHPYTVATIPTLHAAGREDPRVRALADVIRGVVVDECHVAAASSHREVFDYWRRAFWWYGMSGSATDRGDQADFLTVAHLGPVLLDVQPGDLIDAGHLTPPTVRFVRFQHGPYPEGLERAWTLFYRLAVVQNARRNALILDLVRRLPKPCMVFVDDLAHGSALYTEVMRRGFSVDFARGASTPEERRSIIARLKAGSLEVCVASCVFNEGVDVPGLRSVVIAGGRRSVIAALQRAGRATRKSEGKDTAWVVDVEDTGHKTLAAHARTRRLTYLREGYQTLVVDGAEGLV